MHDLNERLGFAALLAAGEFAIGSGRLLPTAAAAIGLLGIVVGSAALIRSGGGKGRGSACFALATGSISAVVGGLHAANAAGGFGTGNGLAGAIVAITLGLLGLGLGGLALVRSRRSGDVA